jgi:hypothetical protein
MTCSRSKDSSQQARITASVRLFRSAANKRAVFARDKPPAENEVRHLKFHCNVRNVGVLIDTCEDPIVIAAVSHSFKP